MLAWIEASGRCFSELIPQGKENMTRYAHVGEASMMLMGHPV